MLCTRRVAVLAPLLSLWLTQISCSTGADKAKPGTPAFYWQAARETHVTRDYLKTVEHLRRVIRTDNEFNLRAQPWRLIVADGLTRTYMQLADDFEMGAKANADAPLPLLKTMASYRTTAETRALEFAETFIMWKKTAKDPEILLDFPFPSVPSMETPLRQKIQGGSLPGEGAMPALEQRLMSICVAESAAAAAGATGDVSKGRTLFQAGSAKVPRDVFALAMATALYNQAQLFSRAKMNKSDRLHLFCTEGLDVLKSIPETAESKKLTSEFEKLAKTVEMR
ncbi:MAG TPA: hypothetical protein VLH09_15130 [Bryobacteraceae bacterium]|nr:hypothetical protein [Bryobacteraceae bacterium]